MDAKKYLSVMIVDLKQYAILIGVSDPAVVRKKISRAGSWENADLLGVISAKKMGNSWVFTIDQKKFEKRLLKTL